MTARKSNSLALFGISLAYACSLVTATPVVEELRRRRPLLNDSDTLTIDGKAPLDAIILVAVALFSAVCCLCLAIWNIYVPSLSSSSTIREERARAKTELRLKGGGGGSGSHGGSASPNRMMVEKKRKQSMGSSTYESAAKIVPTTHSNYKDGPKIAPTNNGRPVRASRGYSTYSKYDIASMARPIGSERSLSMLAVPSLPTGYTDYSSNPSLSSASLNTAASPPTPWHARPGFQDRSHSFGSHNRRVSTTGRGTQLNRTKSRKSGLNNVHVNPQAVDPIYSNQRRLSPRNSASDFNDPLAGHELRRYTTDPSDSREGSRRNSAMNALDFFNHSGNQSYGNRAFYNESGSEGHSNDNLSPATPSAIPRSRPLAFYDIEPDAGSSSSGHRQDTSLLESGGQYTNDPPQAAGGWRIWAK